MTNKERNIIAVLISKAKISRKFCREYAGHTEDDLKPLNEAIKAAEKLISGYKIQRNLSEPEIN